MSREDPAGVAFRQNRANHYRQLAERQTDESLAKHYRHLADAFEKNVHAEDDLLLKRPLDRTRLRSEL
jgi:hypothetical protein